MSYNMKCSALDLVTGQEKITAIFPYRACGTGITENVNPAPGAIDSLAEVARGSPHAPLQNTTGIGFVH